jgi:hypothetical protein
MEPDDHEKGQKKRKRSNFFDLDGAEVQAEELTVDRGGRTLGTERCWEHGAQDGDAFMFFSSVDGKKQDLPARHYRCVLCAHFHNTEVIVKAESGQTNLWSHLVNHKIEKLKAKAAAPPTLKKQATAQSVIETYGRISDKEVRRAAVKLIVQRGQPFSLVEEGSFLDYTRVVSKRQDLKLVTRKTVKEDMKAMAALCRRD